MYTHTYISLVASDIIKQVARASCEPANKSPQEGLPVTGSNPGDENHDLRMNRR